MWTESTVVSAAAWSRRIELDLARAQLQQLRYETALPMSGTSDYPLDAPTDEFDAAFWAAFDRACAAAREQLAQASGLQTVTLAGDGTASVEPVTNLDAAHAANEKWHEERAKQIAYESGRGPDWPLEDRVAHALEHGLPLPQIAGGASAPAFSSAAVNIGSATVSVTASTSLRTAPSNPTTLITAGASGTQVNEIVIEANGTSLAGTIPIFRFDGTTYQEIDEALITAVTVSTTAVPFRTNRMYTNFILKSGDSLRVASSVASNPICVTAHCGDI